MDENTQEGSVSALLVGEYENDRELVCDVFRKRGWRLVAARHGRRAMEWLKRNAVQVVIAENPTAGGWQWLLESLRDLPDPPQLVVTSRTADDYLWSEVLNRGGYDVLAQPLDRDEVERVIAGAGRHYRSMRDGLGMASAAGTAA
jgi:DNA-binding response OmpR family regulator